MSTRALCTQIKVKAMLKRTSHNNLLQNVLTAVYRANKRRFHFSWSSLISISWCVLVDSHVITAKRDSNQSSR